MEALNRHLLDNSNLQYSHRNHQLWLMNLSLSKYLQYMGVILDA